MGKMYDAGRSMDSEMLDMPVAGKKGESKKYYPHLDLTSDAFPMLSDMKIGEKCLLTIEVKPTRMSVNDKGVTDMCMDITQVGMSDDQTAGDSKEQKMDKMVEKMYPKKK